MKKKVHAAGLLTALSTLAGGGWAHSHNQAWSHDDTLVTVADGILQGEADDSVRQFKGIRYAAPPVGALRWNAPQQPAAWQGVQDAGEFGPGCIQPPLPASSIYSDPPRATSEDCLTLNIWTPVHSEKSPVVVWVHGGSLAIGASSLPLYDGGNYARRGIVFVSLNYRLGALGWLAHEELSRESPGGISGNYGLLDQIAAFEWVRDNIAKFGGDPRNITLMGESAGALSAVYLMVSPRARGLFSKAIIQSPNMRAFPRLNIAANGLPSAEEIGAGTLEKLGAKTIAEARGLDAQELTNRAAALGFAPQGTIDGQLLTRQLVETFERGEQARVPVLVGINAHEVRSQPGLAATMPVAQAEYADGIRSAYGNLASDFLNLYPFEEGREAALDAARDGIYGWAAEKIAVSQQLAGIPAYYYVFDYCYPAAASRSLCGFHAGELPFTFGNLEAADLPHAWPVPDGAQDRELSDAMMDYFVGFIREGAPKARGLPTWKAYGLNEDYIRFLDRPVLARDSFPGAFELNEEFNARRRAEGKHWGLFVGLAADGGGAGGEHEQRGE